MKTSLASFSTTTTADNLVSLEVLDATRRVADARSMQFQMDESVSADAQDIGSSAVGNGCPVRP